MSITDVSVRCYWYPYYPFAHDSHIPHCPLTIQPDLCISSGKQNKTFSSVCLQVWFQNRRAKFRKQERLSQQKISSNHSNDSSIKAEGKSSENSSSKEPKPGSPISNLSTTPNSSASSHHSNSDLKPLNGKFYLKHLTLALICNLRCSRMPITELKYAFNVKTVFFRFPQCSGRNVWEFSSSSAEPKFGERLARTCMGHKWRMIWIQHKSWVDTHYILIMLVNNVLATCVCHWF